MSLSNADISAIEQRVSMMLANPTSQILVAVAEDVWRLIGALREIEERPTTEVSDMPDLGDLT